MLRWFRWITVIYWTALTVLLLAPDPWALLGLRPPPIEGTSSGVHFACFLLLGAMAQSSRFAGRPAVWAGVLVAYAVVAELGQGPIPTRSVQWQDLVANLTGLACGALIARTALYVRERTKRKSP
jgi:VanZ family protein